MRSIIASSSWSRARARASETTRSCAGGRAAEVSPGAGVERGEPARGASRGTRARETARSGTRGRGGGGPPPGPAPGRAGTGGGGEPGRSERRRTAGGGEDGGAEIDLEPAALGERTVVRERLVGRTREPCPRARGAHAPLPLRGRREERLARRERRGRHALEQVAHRRGDRHAVRVVI